MSVFGCQHIQNLTLYFDGLAAGFNFHFLTRKNKKQCKLKENAIKYGFLHIRITIYSNAFNLWRHNVSSVANTSLHIHRV